MKNGKLMKQTAETRRVEQLLLEQFPEHPRGYAPEAYRYNPASIRVRVVSRQFKGMNWGQRADLVYPILKENLPQDTWWDISLVLLLTPDEIEDSPGNQEFVHPSPPPVRPRALARRTPKRA